MAKKDAVMTSFVIWKYPQNIEARKGTDTPSFWIKTTHVFVELGWFMR